ncbi:MAG: DUF2550 domain-containing protein [Actinomycetota bacterium]|nr:DUF2550 domain-containing protein [Actinomycetota bacterium]
MPAWQVALDVLGLALLALAVYAVALIARRRWLSRSGGTLDLSLRLRPSPGGRGWVLGLGRYSGDDLQWFRIFSLSLRPKRTLRRSALTVVGRRAAQGREEFALYADAIVVECRYDGEPLALALSENALTGLLAWLEAAPPGRDVVSGWGTG